MSKKPFTPIPPMAELPPAEEIDVKVILDKYLSGEIDLICVLGPTASGKTRYAVNLARQINALLAHRRAGAPVGAERTPVVPCGALLPPAARGVARFSVPVAQTTGNALIIGFGGAGKAAAGAAEDAGMDVTILNRTCRSPRIRPLSDFREEFRKADVVIYTLPVRIPELDRLTEDDCTPGKTKIILEANYRNPAFDEELVKNLTGWNPLITYEKGETWLLMQAVTGYELFTGEKPDTGKMLSVIKSK